MLRLRLRRLLMVRQERNGNVIGGLAGVSELMKRRA